MNKDEEYVRSVWLVSEFSGHIWLSANPDRYFESWLEAAEFTRERLEQVRRAKFDVAHMTRFRNAVGSYCHRHPYADQTLEVEIPNLQSWGRVLALLNAELTRLTAGMKPEAL